MTFRLDEACRDDDFAILPPCRKRVRHAQHDPVVIGRSEITAQQMTTAFAPEWGVALQQ